MLLHLFNNVFFVWTHHYPAGLSSSLGMQWRLRSTYLVIQAGFRTEINKQQTVSSSPRTCISGSRRHLCLVLTADWGMPHSQADSGS